MKAKAIVFLICLTVLLLIVKYGGAIYANAKYMKKVGDLGDEAKKNGQKPSYTNVEYLGFADTIENAKSWYNDDEDAVKSVFNRIYNTLDVAELIKAFGSRDGMNLSGYLKSFMNGSEIETYINKPLKSNGVNFQF